MIIRIIVKEIATLEDEIEVTQEELDSILNNESEILNGMFGALDWDERVDRDYDYEIYDSLYDKRLD